MVKIMYQPRMQDEICVAEFETLEEALVHMDTIAEQHPKAYLYHRIEEI